MSMWKNSKLSFKFQKSWKSKQCTFVQDVVKSLTDLLKDKINNDEEVHKMYRVFLVRRNSDESVEDETVMENYSSLIIKLHSITHSYDGTVAILNQVYIKNPGGVCRKLLSGGSLRLGSSNLYKHYFSKKC